MLYLEEATGAFNLTRADVRRLTGVLIPEADIDLSHLGFPGYAEVAPTPDPGMQAVPIAPVLVNGQLTQAWDYEPAPPPVPRIEAGPEGWARFSAGVMTTSDLNGLSVTRISIGRVRFPFDEPQPDLAFKPVISVIGGTTPIFWQITAKTLTYVEGRSWTLAGLAADALEYGCSITRINRNG
jgi:hypothetical protein